MTKIPVARDIMTKSVIALSPGMDIYEAIRLFLKHKISGAPVTNPDNHVIGILSEKDCMRLILDSAYHNLPSGKVEEYMSPIKQTVNPTTDLFTIAGIFHNSVFRRIPVVEDDQLVGLISRRDVLTAIMKLR